jgi:hypothetical protein
VFDDAERALSLFLELQSQWRSDFGIRTGLDYTAVLSVLELYINRKSEKLSLFEEIKALEHGALMAWADKQAEDKAAEKDSKHPLTLEQKSAIHERRQQRC